MVTHTWNSKTQETEGASELPLVPVYASLDYINSELQAILDYSVRYCLKSTKQKYAN